MLYDAYSLAEVAVEPTRAAQNIPLHRVDAWLQKNLRSGYSVEADMADVVDWDLTEVEYWDELS